MRRWSRVPFLLLVLAATWARAADAPAHLSPAAALRRAGVDGAYAMLLRQIRVPEDADSYGPFTDYGLWTGTEWRGHQDLPPGYWVYVTPYWHIWRDRTAEPQPARSWGPEQVTGPPDTAGFGDISTAWASRTADGEDEWLLVEYPEPVRPNAVKVYETFNPGAVTKVTAFRLDGEEVVAWQGKDPVNAAGLADIALEVDFPTNRIKLYLASRTVPGWNEIDAAGLQDADGKIQWARAAEASTSWAGPRDMGETPQQLRQRILELEAEIRRLKTMERTP